MDFSFSTHPYALKLPVSFSYWVIWCRLPSLRLSICSSVFRRSFFLQDFPSSIIFGILLSIIRPTRPVHCNPLTCMCPNSFISACRLYGYSLHRIQLSLILATAFYWVGPNSRNECWFNWIGLILCNFRQ
jgi:hypothetical protein